MKHALCLCLLVAKLCAQVPPAEILSLSRQELQQRAERGDPMSQWRLADILRSKNFDNLGADYAASLRWMRKAHEQGYVPATGAMGDYYQHGWGVTRDLGTALRYYRQAAAKGHATSQAMLGRIYITGIGVAPNKTEGLKWMTMALNQGDVSAALNLAYYHESGLFGMRKDLIQAAAYNAVAIELGAKGGPEMKLESLKSSLTPAQKADAISRAKAILPGMPKTPPTGK